MAASLLDQVKALATPETVSRISGAIGEDPQATQRALTGAALPAVMGGLVQQFSGGAGPARLMGLVKQHDPDGRLLDQVTNPSAENIGALQSTGQGLISSLFGPRADSVADVVAGHAGVKKSSAMSLLALAAPMVLGFLGQKIMRGGLDAGGLGSMLQGARGELARAAPPGLAQALGVQSFAEQPAGAFAASAATATGDRVYRDREAAPAHGGQAAAAAGVRRWLPWLIAAAILLAILAFFRSRMHNAQAPTGPTATAPPNQTPQAQAPQVQGQVPQAQVQLPGGTTLNLPQNSLAYGLAVYLGQSNAPAPPRRFTFENLRFPTAGSAVPADAQTTLSEVGTILRAYPNTTVRVEGYTDNVGNPQANLALSQSRAQAVRSALVARGVDAGRIQAQGFGEAHPLASNDTEAGRLQNRRTDLVVLTR